jgi:hypothetical protein
MYHILQDFVTTNEVIPEDELSETLYINVGTILNVCRTMGREI